MRIAFSFNNFSDQNKIIITKTFWQVFKSVACVSRTALQQGLEYRWSWGVWLQFKVSRESSYTVQLTVQVHEVSTEAENNALFGMGS